MTMTDDLNECDRAEKAEAVLARLLAMLDVTICVGCGAELDFEVAAVAVPFARPYAVLWPEDGTWAYVCACGWEDEGDAGAGPPTVRDRLPAETDPARLRAELVQVAAVAVAWIEAIDSRIAP